MFHRTSYADGTKVDFWMLTDSPFDQFRFARKRLEPINGFRVYLPSPEDTILAKLRRAKMSGGIEKQLTDTLRVTNASALAST